MHTKYSIKCQKEENARNTRIYRCSAIAYIPVETLHKHFDPLCQEMNYNLKICQWCSIKGEKLSSLTPQTKPKLHPSHTKDSQQKITPKSNPQIREKEERKRTPWKSRERTRENISRKLKLTI